VVATTACEATPPDPNHLAHPAGVSAASFLSEAVVQLELGFLHDHDHRDSRNRQTELPPDVRASAVLASPAGQGLWQPSSTACISGPSPRRYRSRSFVRADSGPIHASSGHRGPGETELVARPRAGRRTSVPRDWFLQDAGASLTAMASSRTDAERLREMACPSAKDGTRWHSASASGPTLEGPHPRGPTLRRSSSAVLASCGHAATVAALGTAVREPTSVARRLWPPSVLNLIGDLRRTLRHVGRVRYARPSRSPRVRRRSHRGQYRAARRTDRARREPSSNDPFTPSRGGAGRSIPDLDANHACGQVNPQCAFQRRPCAFPPALPDLLDTCSG